MKRLVRMLALVMGGLLLLASGLAVLARVIGNQDPLYQGQALDYWLDASTNPDPAVARGALAVLTGVVVPALTNQMFFDTNHSRLRLAVIESLDEIPGLQVQFNPSDGRRVQAVVSLAYLGTAARPAVPALIEALRLKDPVLISAAAGALPRVGADAKTAVPALIPCMSDAEGHGNSDVVDALAAYGPDARAAVPALIKLLPDRSSKEIIHSVPEALRAIDPDAASAAGVK